MTSHMHSALSELAWQREYERMTEISARIEMQKLLDLVGDERYDAWHAANIVEADDWRAVERKARAELARLELAEGINIQAFADWTAELQETQSLRQGG